MRLLKGIIVLLYIWLETNKLFFIPELIWGEDLRFTLYILSYLSLLNEIKKFLAKNFKMIDMDKTTYVIVMKIFRYKYQILLELS